MAVVAAAAVVDGAVAAAAAVVMAVVLVATVAVLPAEVAAASISSTVAQERAWMKTFASKRSVHWLPFVLTPVMVSAMDCVLAIVFCARAVATSTSSSKCTLIAMLLLHTAACFIIVGSRLQAIIRRSHSSRSLQR